MKKLKITVLVLSLVALSGFGAISAQENNKKVVLQDNKHEIRFSVSDGFTRELADIFGIGLVEAILGTKRDNTSSYGVYNLGYRYSMNRFRLGGDVSYTSTSSELTFRGETAPSIKENGSTFFVLPAAEFQYYKRGIVELYGGAALGVEIVRLSYKNLGAKKDNLPSEASVDAYCSWQVNPIAIRLGNNTVGGFLEAGIGHKGFLTAGVNLRF